ncbi:C40 family peptidase [Kitasatospora brasiliensis]|uniref:C40 family peptidase n=1 Tax=Kitasatospora brasiliensis TaxID=3058040 RepID=UPI00292FEE88|nr:C40 family peptidase [Kitasatospora sp. K002]
MARRLLLTLLLSLTALLGLLPAVQAAPAQPAPAEPGTSADPAGGEEPYPTTEEIDQARAEADGKASSIAALEAALTAARVELDRAGRATEQAVEAYNGAQLALARARTEEAAAAQRAAAAEAERSAAAEDAARLAAETYRQGVGAELSALNALLGAHGPREAGDRAVAVGQVSERTRQILDAATSTAAAARSASAAARAATEAAGRAAVAVGAAKVRAEQRLAAQQGEVAAADQRREQLLAELAVARDTTVELERQRREALEAIAAREAEAAARAAAEQAAREAEAAAAQAEAVAKAQQKALPPPATRPWSAEGAAAAVAFAKSKIGLPYIWGGEGPAGYDCSGLTMMAWREGGRQLNHFAADQYAQSTPISYRQLRPGDLVFWTDTGRAADIFHVGLYIGGDQMIEAPRAGKPIKQASLWIMGTPDFYARP